MSVDRELNDITVLLSNCLDAFTAALFTWDERSKQLSLRTYHSLSKQMITHARFSPEEGGLVGWVVKNNHPVTVDHFDRDTRTIPYYEGEENIKSFLAVPLEKGKGVLCVDSKRQYVFTSKDQKLISGFATVIGNALRAGQAEHRHRQLGQLLTLWQRADAQPADADDPVPYLTRLLDCACPYIRADGGLVAVPVKEGMYLQVVATSGKVPSSLLKHALPADQGIIGWIIRNLKPLVIPKVRSRTRNPYLFGPTDGIGKMGALIVVPLAWKPQELGGVIAFICRDEAHWSREEIGAITAIVRRATLVLQNFMLRRELALVRNLDPVTEVCNTESFHRVLNKRLERCKDAVANLGLGIIAIEGLELLGTKVALPDLAPLRQRVATALRQRLTGKQLLGSVDTWCFTVLFEHETPADIRAQLAAMTAAVQGEVLDHMAGAPRLQVRFAFALYPHDATSAHELWTVAYQALISSASRSPQEMAPPVNLL
ncbi:MAG: GAF domain-containing protein [Syntrophobacteria bacterium]